MINSKFLAQLKKEYRAQESERRQIISASNNILFQAKKTIFSLQRQEFDLGREKLNEMEKMLKDLEKRFGSPRLNQEGAYKAAAEEYLEAHTFYQIITGHKIDKVKGLKLDHSSYLGGVCDLIGELVRYATNQAAKGAFGEVEKIKKISEDIMSGLLDFDMTAYLRTKYDQARGHLRKLEQMAYDIKIRTLEKHGTKPETVKTKK